MCGLSHRVLALVFKLLIRPVICYENLVSLLERSEKAVFTTHDSLVHLDVQSLRNFAVVFQVQDFLPHVFS